MARPPARSAMSTEIQSERHLRGKGSYVDSYQRRDSRSNGAESLKQILGTLLIYVRVNRPVRQSSTVELYLPSAARPGPENPESFYPHCHPFSVASIYYYCYACSLAERQCALLSCEAAFRLFS